MSQAGRKTSEVTLESWVRRAAERMEDAGLVFGHGTACAFDEACWMAAHALDLSPDFDDDMMDLALDEDRRSGLERLLAERIRTRQPLAYLLGEAWFAGIRFRVSPAVLVPRSPLAELVVGGFAPWVDLQRPARVLDLGCGSGCIGAAVAWHWPSAGVVAADIDPEALEVARGNVRRLGVEGRVRVVESDLFEALADERYELIVSNPPYVPRASMQALGPEYRAEPATALAGGEDGLDLVRRILAGAPEHLAPGGVLVVEVGEAREGLEELLPQVPFVWLEFAAGGEGVFLLDEPGCRQAAGALASGSA